ncbi:MAG: enhanced serine sensitivity protein SseB C-terminal domain-containing protein [Ruminiclostridium sp.]|nr:enhanced serine sensitivity protein SseB C-terminal domain-containing protein [Ruminiclostridium sp.]
MADNHIKFPGPAEGGENNPIAPESNRRFSPDEVFPDLGNDKLVAAMEALKKDENKETQTALIENVLQAKFFAPVEVLDGDGKLLQGTGKVAIPKDSKFNFKLIQNAKGEQYFTVFTDIKQFMKWSKSPKINTIVVVFPQIAQLAQQKADIISGFVINPMDQNIIFSQDAIASLIDAMKAVAEREKARRESGGTQQVKLMFGKPQNIPDAVYGAFRKKLAKIPEVKTAYFCMLKQGDQEYYLFTLDIDADSETCRDIGDSVCESAKLFLTKYPIMAAPVNSPFGEGAKKVDSPFYTKE